MRTYLRIRTAILVLTTVLAIATGYSSSAQEEVVSTTEKAVESFTNHEMFDIIVVPLEHARASKVFELMAPFSGGDGIITADDDLNAIMLAGPRQITERLEAAIKLLDVPRKEEKENNRNVELIVHLIQGSGSNLDDGTNVDDLPNFLWEVATELSEIFTYGQYRLVDTLFLRCRDKSEASTSGVLPTGSGDAGESIYHFSVDRVSVTDGDPLGIRLDDVSFGATIPIFTATPSQQNQTRAFRQIERQQIGIRADIDVREGQQVVVGKASVSGDESALFVVVSAKVVGG